MLHQFQQQLLVKMIERKRDGEEVECLSLIKSLDLKLALFIYLLEALELTSSDAKKFDGKDLKFKNK